jgi:hypothetical protein
MKLLRLLSIVSFCLLGGCEEENITVVDATGTPIDNAKVYAQSMSMTLDPVLTNTKGETTLPFNIQGTKWISVEKDGFQSAQIAVPETWPVQIVLEKE